MTNVGSHVVGICIYLCIKRLNRWVNIFPIMSRINTKTMRKHVVWRQGTWCDVRVRDVTSDDVVWPDISNYPPEQWGFHRSDVGELLLGSWQELCSRTLLSTSHLTREVSPREHREPSHPSTPHSVTRTCRAHRTLQISTRLVQSLMFFEKLNDWNCYFIRMTKKIF